MDIRIGQTWHTTPLSHPATDRYVESERASAWTRPPTQLTSHPGSHYPVGKPFGLSPSVLLLEKRFLPRLVQSCTRHRSTIQLVTTFPRHHSATRKDWKFVDIASSLGGSRKFKSYASVSKNEVRSKPFIVRLRACKLEMSRHPRHALRIGRIVALYRYDS